MLAENSPMRAPIHSPQSPNAPDAMVLALVASCRLHGLDVESYLTDVIRVMPYWPPERYLELAPKYWSATRHRIPERELELALGPATVPPPAEQQPSPN